MECKDCKEVFPRVRRYLLEFVAYHVLEVMIGKTLLLRLNNWFTYR
jgi:hypothetical protein